jgi:putative spermidine/putrescine transport system permease protein
MKRLGDHIATGLFAALFVLVLAFLLVPLAISVILSFDGRSFIGKFPPPRYSLRWYESLAGNSAYYDAFLVSLQIGLIATVIATVAGGAAALFLTRYDFPGRGSLETALLSPKFVPTVVIGFALLSTAGALGIVDGWWRLVAGHLIVTLPFTVRATLAALVGVRRSLLEAAQTLGASEWRAYWDITLPLARSGIVSGALFAFVMSFDEVALSLFLSDPFSQTLPVVLVSEMRANLSLTIAAVSTILVGATVFLVILLARFAGLGRLFGEGIYRP